MKKHAVRLLVITSLDRAYWEPLHVVVDNDPDLEIHYVQTERAIEAKCEDGISSIIVTDLSPNVPTIKRLREVVPATSRILAFIPSERISVAIEELRNGLYDYVIAEYPERLRHAISHIRKEIEAEETASRALAKVQSAEEQQRFLIENILDIITVTDINATILYESASLERVLGYAPEDLIGKNAFAYIHPLDIPRTMPVFMLAIATPGVPHSTRFRFKHKNGSWRMLEVVGKTLRDPELGFRLIVTSRDITDRERAEEALGESELRFRSVIESLSEGITITSQEGEVSYFNSRMTELTGFEPNDVLGKKLYSLIIPRESWTDRESWIGSKAARKPQKMETEILRKDGSRIWVEIRTTPYRDGEQQLGTISAFVDITQRRRLQQQRELEHEQAIEAKDRAEEANRLKSNFLANLSHELRTPLTGILGFANVLEEQVADEELKVYTRHITSAGSRLLGTMNSLIDLSKIESGDLELSLAPTLIAPELHRVVEMMRPLAEAKSLAMNVHYPDEPITAYIDAHYFSETVRHVLTNAVKFTERGAIEIELGHDPASNSAVLTIRDTGVGISQDFLPHVFDAFRQESDGFGRTYEGNGLGLTLAQSFLAAMGGTISVTSTRGKGSTFSMTYPLSPALAAAPQKRGFFSRLRTGT